MILNWKVRRPQEQANVEIVITLQMIISHFCVGCVIVNTNIAYTEIVIINTARDAIKIVSSQTNTLVTSI